MRTSATQTQLLVEYMERNGDLSKPTQGPHGRVTNVQCWADLTAMLNADATGDTKTVEKWRKTWSDLKNNIKKKSARIHQAMHGTGGGPAINLKLSDLEQRVLSIIGTRAATGIVEIPELGLENYDPQMEINESPSIFEIHEVVQQPCSNVGEWNRPGPSTQPYSVPLLLGREALETVNNPSVTVLHEVDTNVTCSGEPAAVTGRASARPRAQQSPTPLPPTPRRRRRRLVQVQASPIHRRTRTQTQSDLARQAFVRSDCEWRSFQQEVEQERNRLRELELGMQQRWLDLFGQFLELGNRIVDVYEKK